MTLHLNVDNKNEFGLGLNTLEYEVWLVEVRIGGRTGLSKSAVIGKKKGNGVVEIPTSFGPKDFGLALWDVIGGKWTGYSLKGCLDVDTPFGPMPFNEEGESTQINKADDMVLHWSDTVRYGHDDTDTEHSFKKKKRIMTF